MEVPTNYKEDLEELLKKYQRSYEKEPKITNHIKLDFHVYRNYVLNAERKLGIDLQDMNYLIAKKKFELFIYEGELPSYKR